MEDLRRYEEDGIVSYYAALTHSPDCILDAEEGNSRYHDLETVFHATQFSLGQNIAG